MEGRVLSKAFSRRREHTQPEDTTPRPGERRIEEHLAACDGMRNMTAFEDDGALAAVAEVTLRNTCMGRETEEARRLTQLQRNRRAEARYSASGRQLNIHAK